MGSELEDVGTEAFPTFLQKKVTPKCVAEIMKQLSAEERVLHVESPLFWQASGALFVVGFLGSIALIVVGAVLGKQSTSWLVYLALFPGLLIYGILCYWKRRDSYVAFTDKKFITHPIFDDVSTVSYATLEGAISVELNYLQCRRELHVKWKEPNTGKSRVSFIEAIPNLEFYREFLEEKQPQRQLTNVSSSESD